MGTRRLRCSAIMKKARCLDLPCRHAIADASLFEHVTVLKLTVRRMGAIAGKVRVRTVTDAGVTEAIAVFPCCDGCFFDVDIV